MSAIRKALTLARSGERNTSVLGLLDAAEVELKEVLERLHTETQLHAEAILREIERDRQVKELEAEVEPETCQTCNSPQPHLHPAMNHGGEVQICSNAFHLKPTPSNGAGKAGSAEEKRFTLHKNCDGNGWSFHDNVEDENVSFTEVARLLNEREKYRAALEQIKAQEAPNGHFAWRIAREALK